MPSNTHYIIEEYPADDNSLDEYSSQHSEHSLSYETQRPRHKCKCSQDRRGHRRSQDRRGHRRNKCYCRDNDRCGKCNKCGKPHRHYEHKEQKHKCELDDNSKCIIIKIRPCR